jgi:hypothetical protein
MIGLTYRACAPVLYSPSAKANEPSGNNVSSARQHIGKQHAALSQIGKGTRIVLHPSGDILPDTIKAHWLKRAGRAKLIVCLNEDAFLR